MLRASSIKKTPEVIICTLSFILICLSLLEIWKELLMREHEKQPCIICTILVGRHNYKYADISMLVHGCGVSQYPQFYDIVKKINCHHIHMWEVI